MATQTNESDSPRSTKPRPNAIVGCAPAFIEPERRGVMIAEAAYYRAERRCFEPGHELEDWLAAEGEIDGMSTGNAVLPAAPEL
jgi:hypothetical protein